MEVTLGLVLTLSLTALLSHFGYLGFWVFLKITIQGTDIQNSRVNPQC